MGQYDVIVIGGGPGGYVAAIRAAQLSLKVALIEKEELGGVCLNWGCIPTKSLLKSAEVFSLIKEAEKYGITTSAPQFNIKQIVARSREISQKLTSGIGMLLKKNKVTHIKAHASLVDNTTVQIKEADRTSNIKAKNIIIATGARAKILTGFEPDGKHIWTAKEAMIPDEMPKSLIIVGSGAIGIEFASFYNALGVEVTVLEAQNNILSTEDEEISTLAKKIFESKKIKFHTGIKLLKQSTNKTGIVLEFEINNKKTTITADRLLMAIGIAPNVEQLGLEKTQITLEKAHIITNDFMQTKEPNIYAIGDVTKGPWLAHKASHEGIIAAEHIGGLKPHKINVQNIPSCIYSSPQIASVGMSEAQAKTAGLTVKIGKFPFMANGKALVLGEPEGLIKTIFDAKTGELLGAHMIGAEVTELIQGYVVHKNMEGTELDLLHTIFAHPTLSEMMHEAVLASDSRAIHI